MKARETQKRIKKSGPSRLKLSAKTDDLLAVGCRVEAERVSCLSIADNDGVL